MLLVAGTAIFARRNDFGLGRTMEITVNMMRELALGYVDPIDADRLLEGAAAGMVSDLDPYTEFFSEEGMSDFEILTTGKYGGVGALIRQKDDWVRIAQPYEGSPADRGGLKIGDRILAIDGEPTRGYTTEQVSALLKGEPGSRVKVTVEHLDSTRQTVTLRRERISIPGVPYAGWVADGIGYIRHSDFTEGCYEQMRAAIERLRGEGELRGLILDYRSNGGGILQEAVKILSMFVPKGTVVLTTRGRTEQKEYRTESEPILPDLPLAVLVNGNTASSSEIVAGALQDLDRAVLIGQRSFGKGARADHAPAGLQHDAQAHHGQILHPLGALHPGRGLLALAAGRRAHRSPTRSSRSSRRAPAARSTTAAASCPTSAPNPNTSRASPLRSTPWASSRTSATTTRAATPGSRSTCAPSRSPTPTTPTSRPS